MVKLCSSPSTVSACSTIYKSVITFVFCILILITLCLEYSFSSKIIVIKYIECIIISCENINDECSFITYVTIIYNKSLSFSIFKVIVELCNKNSRTNSLAIDVIF